MLIRRLTEQLSNNCLLVASTAFASRTCCPLLYCRCIFESWLHVWHSSCMLLLFPAWQMPLQILVAFVAVALALLVALLTVSYERHRCKKCETKCGAVWNDL